MHEIRHRVALPVTPQRAWPVLTHFVRWPLWTPTVTRIVRLTSTPSGYGTRVRITQPKLGVAEWRITEWSPGASFTWESQSPGVVITASHALLPAPEGATLELAVRFDGPLSGLANLLFGKLTREYVATEAEGFRARCESIGEAD